MKMTRTGSSFLILMIFCATLYSCVSKHATNHNDHNNFSRGLYLIRDVSVIPMSKSDSTINHANVVVISANNVVISANNVVIS